MTPDTTLDTLHRATSADGTEVVGRVHGQGPPLVLVSGGPGDGERSWTGLLPGLTDAFTCHCMSTRSKGLSGHSDDHAAERYAEDVAAYIDSIGEPVGLFGHSSGAIVATEAAEKTDMVGALALYEPADFSNVADSHQARLDDAVARLTAALDEGRTVDAARIFMQDMARTSDEEVAALAGTGVYEDMAPYVWTVFQHVQQSGPPHLADPTLPERLTMPVLLLHGEKTDPSFLPVISSFESRFPDVRTRVIPGAGHLGPQLHGPAVATELVSFLSRAL